tara:strand:+ start:77 stop:472 length:396 start_codon:yes stop_codon:yes gene_type:complete
VSLRRCKICGLEKDKETFPKARKKNSGDGYWYRRICAKCYYHTKTPCRARNKGWLTTYKRRLACQDCGYSAKTHKRFVVQALQFHHKDKNKSFAISDGVQRGMSIELLKKEIDKCVVLCARCHIEEHFYKK